MNRYQNEHFKTIFCCDQMKQARELRCRQSTETQAELVIGVFEYKLLQFSIHCKFSNDFDFERQLFERKLSVFI